MNCMIYWEFELVVAHLLARKLRRDHKGTFICQRRDIQLGILLLKLPANHDRYHLSWAPLFCPSWLEMLGFILPVLRLIFLCLGRLWTEQIPALVVVGMILAMYFVVGHWKKKNYRLHKSQEIGMSSTTSTTIRTASCKR